MMTTWIEPQPIDVPKDLQTAIGGHPLVADVLARRGYNEPRAAQAFIDADRYQPASPFDLPGMSAAVERLEKAIQNGEMICVWGDFDVDGQTSTSVLFSALESLGAQVSYHIPVRASESHGINLPVLEGLIRDGIELVLTCDTGISAHEAIQYANSQGVDVIVTDHHDLPEELPDAHALVNPKLLVGDTQHGAHPLAALPGVGVAYQLVKALYAHAGRVEEVESFLDLVALGIVADLALVVADTRHLLQRGLQVLRKTERLGLQAMMIFADIDPAYISEDHIAFGLAPRLNALGRLSDANGIVEFLTNIDSGDAQVFAQRLEQLNARRKLLTDQVFQAAQARLKREPALLEDAALVLSHPAWPAGVIGIVASQLVEQYNRPVVLISSPKGMLARGSARSVEGCNITAAIATQANLLVNYGGHPMAAGLGIDPKNIPAFRRGLVRAVEQQLGAISLEPSLQVDAYLPLSALSPVVVTDLERLAPFGPGNPALTLACENLRLKGYTPIGRTGEHLKLTVEDSQEESYKVICWNGAGMQLPEGRFDLAYIARSSNYMGQPEVQIEWLHARPLEEPAAIQIQKRKIEVIDYRGEEHPLVVLNTIVRQQEQLQIWAEADAQEKLNAQGIASEDRLSLVASKPTAIWSTPPSREALDQILERVSPQRVYLFAVNPETRDEISFLERLVGLVKHAIHHKDGLVHTEQLAAKTAQIVAAVKAGIRLLSDQGYIKILVDEDDVLKLVEGDQVVKDLDSKASHQLRNLLNESTAFRSHFARAEAETLINPTDD